MTLHDNVLRLFAWVVLDGFRDMRGPDPLLPRQIGNSARQLENAVIGPPAELQLAHGWTALIGGSGFLAVYVAGMVLGNHLAVRKRTLLRFHHGAAWLMQVMMFLILGLLVSPRQLVRVAGGGLLFAVFLML